MVKREKKSSVSEDDAEPKLLDENGKWASNAPNKKRLKTKGLYRQPTVNELNRLQETENLFNSNLFRLQVEEILQEVKVKEKTIKKFQKWFEEFRNHLLSIPEDNTEYDLIENRLFKQLKVKLPVGGQLKKTKCVFKFHKFKDVKIVGSYALDCAINSKLRVDIQITVPSDTYTKNDSINYRYHKKRAAYLAYLASHLKHLEIIDDLKYSCLNGCETKPVIDLKPNTKLGNHVSVRIYLTCEEEAYKLHRFSPIRNNLREAWLFSLKNPEDNNEVGPPTPYYNGSILSDLTANINQEYLKDALDNNDNLKQAIVLLKIWLRQRKLQVSGHVVSMFVAYLVQVKRINNIMSSYQIVRNAWISLKTSEWDTKGISLYKGQDSPPMEQFLEHFPIVFLDKTGYYNICWQMHKGTYNSLKRESALAVEMLDSSKTNSFIPLFMTPVEPLMLFDHILKFKSPSNIKESIISRIPKEAKMNYGVDKLALIANTLYTLLAKGLGNRVDLILQIIEADFSWPVKTDPEQARADGYEEHISFGFILNLENSLNIVEKGPPANLPEAERFRAFWGDKSELRRFQDGSITETCVWEGETLAERRGIPKQIVDYLLQLKYEIPSSELFHICDQLDSLTTRKQYASTHKLQAEESSVEALRAFDELRKDLRGLTELPLDISAVYGTSAVFSYCDPLPPLPRAAPRNPWRRGGTYLIKDITRTDGLVHLPEYTPVCKAVVELGHSGKWPGDIEAFRCLKAAFHLQLSDRLNKQYSLATQPYPTHIDVLKNGLVFRLEIVHAKEITLLRRHIENGVVKFIESEESVSLQCQTVLLPRLRGALHALHQKHPAYGPVTCIFKRWLSSHLLSQSHFPPIVAELLVAGVFIHSYPLLPPSQPTCGFLRVLRSLAETDWTKEMILLDFNEDMKREEIMELERGFNSRTEQMPCIYIVTAYDGNLPSVWSMTSPSPLVVARAQVLARSALKYVENTLLKDLKDNVLAACIPSLSGYDVIIHLHSPLVPYNGERLDKQPELRPLPEASDDIIPIVEFNPVDKYLDELRNAYSDYALFFHDSYGGDIIAVLWKPDIADTKELQLSNANALKPVKVKEEIEYKINISALIEDFRILGEGLVRDIAINA